MIFKKVTFHNFGIYAGRHEISIAPKTEKTIIVFGALNGAGKTTLLEGIQFALYGKNSKFLARNTYGDFLANSINRNSTQDSASVALEFTATLDGRYSSLEVVRTWTNKGKLAKEYPIQVFKDGILDHDLSSRWDELVENFFPNQLSELFFFDGEKIESLAQPKLCADLVKTGLNTLLGLDLVSDLSKTLSILDRKLQVSTVSEKERKAVEKLEELIAHHSRRRKQQEASILGLCESLNTVSEALVEANDDLRKNGGDLYVERETLKNKEDVLVAEYDDFKRSLVDFAATKAPLLILSKEIDALVKHCESGITSDQREAVLSALDVFSRTLITQIENDKSFSENQTMLINEVRESYIHEHLSKTAEPAISISSKLLGQIQAELPLIKKDTYKLLVDLSKKLSEVESIQGRLLAVPDDQKIKPLIEKVQNLELEKQQIESEIKVLESHKNQTSLDLSVAEGDLNKLMIELSDGRAEEERGRLMKMRLQSGKKILSAFSDLIREKHIARLEVKIKDCMDALLRKKTFLKSVSIDKNSYQLTIKVEGKGSIPAAKLSAGERQLLAISVLWALASLSEKKLPTIVDTPLGRLDSKSRTNLIENYFPNAGSQVILLSTDEEIVGSYYKSLKPFIAKEYVIEYDEDSQSSVVRPGYFESHAGEV